MSRRVPTAVERSTSAMLSGRPWVGLRKCVYLKERWLRESMTHDPSAVPILRRASLPDPVVPEAFDRKRSLVSVRFDSR